MDGKGQGIDMLKFAVQKQGVNCVECFGPKLSDMYKGVGMHVVDTHPFDPAQAPANWNYARDGTPNYYTMRLSQVAQKGMDK